MARISKYINDETFSEKDKVVGSSYVGTVNGVDQFKTRNFSMATLKERLGDKTFVFSQISTASDTWVINHNLLKFPSVTVVDTAGSVVQGEITYTDNNNLTLTFSAAFKGTAYLN
jgi:hypothetical protein